MSLNAHFPVLWQVPQAMHPLISFVPTCSISTVIPSSSNTFFRIGDLLELPAKNTFIFFSSCNPFLSKDASTELIKFSTPFLIRFSNISIKGTSIPSFTDLISNVCAGCFSPFLSYRSRVIFWSLIISKPPLKRYPSYVVSVSESCGTSSLLSSVAAAFSSSSSSSKESSDSTSSASANISSSVSVSSSVAIIPSQNGRSFSIISLVFLLASCESAISISLPGKGSHSFGFVKENPAELSFAFNLEAFALNTSYASKANRFSPPKYRSPSEPNCSIT